MFRRFVVLALPVLAAAWLTACGGSADEGAQAAARTVVDVSPGEIRAGDAVPAPDGRPTVRVRGTKHGNARGATALDLATLDRLPRVRVTVQEPFRKRDMTFEGVRLVDLLQIAGAPTSEARRVYLHALDDYHVSIPLTALAGSDAVLATEADGRAVPVEEGGPVRLVFPDGTKLGTNTDNWIWSVDWMRTVS
jgi:hypothetical protein